MEEILTQIEKALGAQAWYAAMVLTFTLPDICASLENPGARKDGVQSRYLRWCRSNLPNTFLLSPDQCYDLRNGGVHNGEVRVPQGAVLTLVPEIHRIVIMIGDRPHMCIGLRTCCNEMIAAVRKWYAAQIQDDSFRERAEKLLQFRDDRFAPQLRGLWIAL